MSRKPVPAQSGERSRAELTFDRPQLMAQLFGEFDKNLDTGKFWYINNPADIHDWGTQLHSITNPPSVADYNVLPQKRGG